jgi:hypothetical protein
LFDSCKGTTNFHKNIQHLQHSASRLLSKFSKSGVPVLLKTRPWTLRKKIWPCPEVITSRPGNLLTG